MCLAHDIFLIVKKWIAHATHILPLNHYIEGIHHELTLTGVNLRNDAAAFAGFITTGFAVFCPLVHDHLSIGFHRGRATRGVRRFADIRKRHRYPVGHLANIRENHAHASTAFVSEALDIMYGATHGNKFG